MTMPMTTGAQSEEEKKLLGICYSALIFILMNADDNYYSTGVQATIVVLKKCFTWAA
jgi:hypothetical protein